MGTSSIPNRNCDKQLIDQSTGLRIHDAEAVCLFAAQEPQRVHGMGEAGTLEFLPPFLYIALM